MKLSGVSGKTNLGSRKGQCKGPEARGHLELNPVTGQAFNKCTSSSVSP